MDRGLKEIILPPQQAAADSRVAAGFEFNCFRR